MPVSDFALITLAQFKNQLALTDVNTQRDTWLISMINAVSQEAETAIGRGIVAREYQQYLNGSGLSTLWVPQYPVLSIVTLWDDVDTEFARDTDIIKESARVIDKEANGLIRVKDQVGTFQKGHDNIKIFYYAGYAELDISWGSTQLTFSEVSGGTRYTVTIPPGRHDVVTLGSLVSQEMNRVGLNTYHVRFAHNLRTYSITLATGPTGTLQLHTNTGTNTLFPRLGYGTSGSDLTGATSYTPSTIIRPRVPFDLEQMAIDVVVFHYDRSGFGAVQRGVKSEMIGDYSISYAGVGELPPFTKTTIDRYRTWNII